MGYSRLRMPICLGRALFGIYGAGQGGDVRRSGCLSGDHYAAGIALAIERMSGAWDAADVKSWIDGPLCGRVRQRARRLG